MNYSFLVIEIILRILALATWTCDDSIVLSGLAKRIVPHSAEGAKFLAKGEALGIGII